MTFSWTPPSNGGSVIIDYQIYWDNAEGTYTLIASTTFGATSYEKYIDADGSMAGRSYFFKVAAVNSIGAGPLSAGYNIVSATFPDPPSALTRNNVETS